MPTDSKQASGLPKQDRYKSEDGVKDFIDESYETMEFNEFVAAMYWTMRKYMKRFGKKDKLSKESYKIMDYATRVHEKVLLEEAKDKQHKTIDELV